MTNRDCTVDMIAPLCGYSTPEAVYAILGDLIGKIQYLKLGWQHLTLHGRKIV